MNTKHLKSKILDLAIRGKLVPQDSSEGNAADLLKKIRDEKGGERLPLAAAGRPSSATPSAGSIAARNARSKNASFIIKADNGRHYEQFADGMLKDIEDEIPFEIPESWCWCRLKEITTLLGDGLHGSPKYNKNGDYYFINGNNLDNGKIVFKSDTKKVDIAEFEKYKKELNEYSVLVSINGTLGNIAFYKNEKVILGKSACYFNLTNKEFKNYIFWLIKTSFFLNYANTEATGSTIKNVSLDSMRNFLFPLPPLSEQQRIVSAIEKSFEQIDIIEKNKLNLKTYIKQTKSKVLDLAIHGKLAAQNPQEGNAFELLEKIRNEKAELIKQKKLKEDKSAGFIIKANDGRHYEQFADGTQKDIEDEIPFKIPENWCWCRFRDLFTHSSGKALKQTNTEGELKDYLTTSNIYWNRFNFSEVRKMHFKKDELDKCTVTKNDILVCNGGDVGRSAIWNYDYDICIQNHVSRLRRIDQRIVVQYFFYLLWFYKNSGFLSGKGIGISSLTIGDILSLFIPLPPLSEQQRIVAKIEQIFAQLDALEKSLGE